ncbi:MAG: sulfite exporter TauE/SafE family protein [Myxococcales bacterium]|nr:sulfite exporter TauE/SafE family protein [Myxococcales bacterium]
MNVALSELSWIALVAYVAMSVFAALVQGTLGFGFAIISVPALALLDPRLAPVPQLVVQLPLTWYIYWRERGDLDRSGVLWTTIGGIPGTVIGVWLLSIASAAALDALNGVIVLAGVVVLLLGLRLTRTPTSELLAGTFSGISSTVSAMGGPPIALLYQGAKGPTVRATLSMIFFIAVVLSIIGRLFTDDGISRLDLELTALGLLPVALGLWASRFLTGRVEGRPMRIGILALSAASALGLLWRAAVA